MYCTFKSWENYHQNHTISRLLLGMISPLKASKWGQTMKNRANSSKKSNLKQLENRVRYGKTYKFVKGAVVVVGQ